MYIDEPKLIQDEEDIENETVFGQALSSATRLSQIVDQKKSNQADTDLVSGIEMLSYYKTQDQFKHRDSDNVVRSNF